MVRRMFKHKGDVSEGSKGKVMAKRWILGKRVTFYENGLREVKDEDLSEEDQHNSEVLRLTHASLLINDAVGDKKSCYVDARVDPVEVIIYGMPATEFIKRAKTAVKAGEISEDFILGSTIRETKELTHVRNVRLFGRRTC